MGHSPHSHKESDTTETTEHSCPSGILGLPKLIRQLGLRWLHVSLLITLRAPIYSGLDGGRDGAGSRARNLTGVRLKTWES